MKRVEGLRRSHLDEDTSVTVWIEDEETLWIDYVSPSQFSAWVEIEGRVCLALVRDVIDSLLREEYKFSFSLRHASRTLRFTKRGLRGFRMQVGR